MQAGVIGYHFTVAGVGVSAYQISTNVKFNVSVCFELPYLHVYTLCFNLALQYVKYVPCLMLIVLHILLDGVGRHLAVRSEGFSAPQPQPIEPQPNKNIENIY